LPDVFDAGIGGVVGAALTVFAAHSGQGCALQTRVLVPEERRHEVVDAIAAAAGTLTIGPPSEASTLVGPLITQTQRGRVDALVQQSVSEGARLVAGGKVPDGFERGWF